ncbi:hypothetical protein [Coleofasciculus sp. FACHB-SPT9]|uniref:hypothetical protein n=1 Tax=Cyanophyceae TaxID=3028117 RepID=UPI001686EA19|nr:hypothetical protein [Coleofasciculus sp. FACHB-SPT9]MBD1891021.1 hypothetical protein [Coleofasciculus sp. FACHB-SPT9]
MRSHSALARIAIALMTPATMKNIASGFPWSTLTQHFKLAALLRRYAIALTN